MKIILEYLTEEQRKNPAYAAVHDKLIQLNSVRCHTLEELNTELATLNTDHEPCLITILTHGHERGITFGTYASLLTWAELCEVVNSRKTVFPLTLNLVGICNSYKIGTYKKVLGHNIQKIWVSNDFVDSISKSLLLSELGSFDLFIGNLDDQEKSKYKEIV